MLFWLSRVNMWALRWSTTLGTLALFVLGPHCPSSKTSSVLLRVLAFGIRYVYVNLVKGAFSEKWNDIESWPELYILFDLCILVEFMLWYVICNIYMIFIDIVIKHYVIMRWECVGRGNGWKHAYEDRSRRPLIPLPRFHRKEKGKLSLLNDIN